MNVKKKVDSFSSDFNFLDSNDSEGDFKKKILVSKSKFKVFTIFIFIMNGVVNGFGLDDDSGVYIFNKVRIWGGGILFILL